MLDIITNFVLLWIIAIQFCRPFPGLDLFTQTMRRNREYAFRAIFSSLSRLFLPGAFSTFTPTHTYKISVRTN
jgi:hypothetical protein